MCKFVASENATLGNHNACIVLVRSVFPLTVISLGSRYSWQMGNLFVSPYEIYTYYYLFTYVKAGCFCSLQFFIGNDKKTAFTCTASGDLSSVTCLRYAVIYYVYILFVYTILTRKNAFQRRRACHARFFSYCRYNNKTIKTELLLIVKK